MDTCVKQGVKVRSPATPTKATPAVVEGSLAGTHNRRGPDPRET